MERVKQKESVDNISSTKVSIKQWKHIFEINNKKIQVKAHDFSNILKFIDTLSKAFSICKINRDCNDNFYIDNLDWKKLI